MAFPSEKLEPRPLWHGEKPERGDLHFAIGLGRDSALVSRVIAVGTASRTNHVGVITGVTEPEGVAPGSWTIVEALAAGVVEDPHSPPPTSTVIRVSDDAGVREALAAAAERKARQQPHIAYDWWAIGRIVFIGLVGRVPFLTFPILAGPPLARYLNPVWVPLVVTVAAIVVLYRLQGLLFRLVMACPWPAPDKTTHLICSALARTMIEDLFSPDPLPGLAHEDVAITAPGDLFQELLHRSDYWSVTGDGFRRRSVLDERVPRS